MLRAGLTGGIACGKSVVASLLREHGCHVIEADPVAHQVMEPAGPAYDDIIAEFGKEILDEDGRIVRSRVARIVFAQPARLARLNQIVHPHVRAMMSWKMEKLAEANPEGVAVIEAAILIETGYYKLLDRLIVAWCRPEQQLERLLARGMTREQAEERIAAQMPAEEKRKYAHDEVDCSGTMEFTRAQVEELAARLKQLARG
jgi:dephospho-CoA kinase